MKPPEQGGRNPAWISRRSDEEIEAAIVDSAGPLAGMRLAVKDNVDVVGFPTTAACPSFAYQPEATAPAVERLERAGAVVVGKTNMDQFATGLVGTRSPYGAVENPLRPGRVAGGSSSGSAAAVATGEADLAVATDTAGSGRVPAAFCGLVGLKGTRGWVPTTGVVGACPSFDCTTVMARTIREASTAMRLMAGPDSGDPRARQRPPGLPPEVDRLGIASPDDLQGCSPETVVGYERALERADAAGFTLSEVGLDPFFAAGDLLYGGAFVAERHAVLADFLATGPEDLDPAVATILEAASSLTASSYAADQDRLARLTVEASRPFHDVDCLLLPTTPWHPTLDEVAADPIGVNLRLGRFVSPVNLLDWCAAVVPLGGPSEPYGAQLAGPAWADEVIWDAAARLLDEPSAPSPGPDRISVGVVGAHMEGQPLNHQLTSRGARLLRRVRTAAAYRLVALDGPIPRPGLLRDSATAAAIEVEVWEIDALGLGELVADIPAPLAIGTIELEDGAEVHGFLCESEPADSALDISSFGGWRAWLEDR